MPKHAKKVTRRVRREPVLIAAVASVLVTLAALLGLDLDRELASAIATVAVLAFGVWARSRVTPVDDPQLDPAALAVANIRHRNSEHGLS